MPRVEVAIGGSMAKLVGKITQPPSDNPGGGIRGKVCGFSRASRKRMLDLLNSIDRSTVSSVLFIDLTYPSAWPQDETVWKRDLDAFFKRLRRRWPNAAAIWRLEFQKRGAPHFHLLLFGVQRVPKAWLSSSWYQVVGSGDPRHLEAGTRVRRVRSWRGVVSYVTKGMAREHPADRDTGRMWGIVGRKNLPIRLLTVPLSWSQWHRVRRVLRGWLERLLGRRLAWGRRYGMGMTAYIDSDTVMGLLKWCVE